VLVTHDYNPSYPGELWFEASPYLKNTQYKTGLAE
jgi:hypothetical protein